MAGGLNEVKNTDREIWCERPDGQGDRIFITDEDGIGIDCGGLVIVKSLRDWHALGMHGGPPQRPGDFDDIRNTLANLYAKLELIERLVKQLADSKYGD